VTFFPLPLQFYLFQSINNLGLKASVGIELGHVPHHSTRKGAAEALGVLEDRSELRARDVAATSTRASGNADKKLDVGIGARLGPGVPGLVVVVVLGAGAGCIAADAARVVVELNLDPVHGYGVDQRTDSSVGEEALRSSREVVLLAAGSVRKALELGAKGREVVGRRFKVEVEAVHYSTSKGTLGRAARLNRPEHGPNLVGCSLGSTGRAPAALGVGIATKRKEDGLAVGLASLDIRPLKKHG
jgi:hypothetical protein